MVAPFLSACAPRLCAFYFAPSSPDEIILELSKAKRDTNVVVTPATLIRNGELYSGSQLTFYMESMAGTDPIIVSQWPKHLMSHLCRKLNLTFFLHFSDGTVERFEDI